MKNKRLRALALLLSAVIAVSLAVPALAGDGELPVSSSADPEEKGVAESDYDEEGPESNPVQEEKGEALQAVSVAAIPEQYTVTIAGADGGQVFFSQGAEDIREMYFAAGEMISLRVIPDDGYRTEEVLIRYESGAEDRATYRETEDLWEFVLREENARIETAFAGAGTADSGEEKAAEVPASEEGDSAVVRDNAQAEGEVSGLVQESTQTGAEGSGIHGDTGTETEGQEQAEREAGEEPQETEDTGEEGSDEVNPPAASTRLLVRTSDASLLDEEAVIGVMEDVYLLQFESKEEAGDALAVYEEEAEFVAEDLVVCAADYGEFPTGDPGAEIVMTEVDNPFSDAAPVTPVAAAKPLIALIDTGVSGSKEISGRYSVMGDDGYDRNGHGDAMLGTIRGFDPKAEVISVKALND